MKKIIIIPAILLGVFLISFRDLRVQPKISGAQLVDSLADERKKIVLGLLDSLKGKETMAADSVFTNLKTFTASQRLPVRHFLGVMNYWGSALGVSCNFCHAKGNWASDELKTKRLARDMYNMRQTINDEILAKMPDIDPKLAQVNCTTCHNGKALPRR